MFWRGNKDGAAHGVTAESFEYHERVGAGSFGTVYRVTLQRSGEELALKVLRRKKDLKYPMAERQILASLRHPYILPLRYAFQKNESLALVLPFCPHGDLQGLVRRHGQLSPALARHYLAQLTLAVTHLHERDIIHRDLKPENVLLDAESQAMLSDFGLAKSQAANVSNDSFVGSVQYVAPEVLEDRGYDRSVDVYGLGITLYVLMVGKAPFEGTTRKQVWHRIRQGALQIPETLPADASAFIDGTMRRSPAERLAVGGTAELWQHAFFRSVDFDAMLRREVPCPEPQEAPTDRPSSSQARPAPTVKRIFGGSLFDSRATQCLLPRPVKGWNFDGFVGSALSDASTDCDALSGLSSGLSSGSDCEACG